MIGLGCKKAVASVSHWKGCTLAGSLLVPVVPKNRFAGLKDSPAALGDNQVELGDNQVELGDIQAELGDNQAELGGIQSGVVAAGLHHKAAARLDTAAGTAAAAAAS